MKYTEQEFKLDHVFDFIRYIFSSPFLAPFRFTNELTRKLPYLSRSILWSICGWGLGFDVLLIVINLVNQYIGGEFSLIKGNIPLIAHIVSILPMLLLLYFVANMNQSKFKLADKEAKARKAAVTDEHYFEGEDGYNVNETTEEVEPDNSSITEYSAEELNYDNLDNLRPSGISQTIANDIELDLSGLEEGLMNSDFTTECEIPSSVGDNKIQDAINNDEFNLEKSSLNTVNIDNQPTLEELPLDMIPGLDDIKLDLDNVIGDLNTSIDFSKYDNNFKL